MTQISDAPATKTRAQISQKTLRTDRWWEYPAVVATPPRPDDADNTLRFGFGTDASPSDIVAFKRRFGCPIIEGYGSSEGAISMTRVPGTPRQAIGCPRREPRWPSSIRYPGTSVRRHSSMPGDAYSTRPRPSGRSSVVTGLSASKATTPTRKPRPKARGADGSGQVISATAYEAGFFYFAGRPADWLASMAKTSPPRRWSGSWPDYPASSPPLCIPFPIRGLVTRSWPPWS